jgi:hypothetical protein
VPLFRFDQDTDDFIVPHLKVICFDFGQERRPKSLKSPFSWFSRTKPGHPSSANGVPLRARHPFRFTEKACVYRHSATLAAFETEVVDPVLAGFGWFSTLGAAPVAPGYLTLDLTDAIRSERYRPAQGAHKGTGLTRKGNVFFNLLCHEAFSQLPTSGKLTLQRNEIGILEMIHNGVHKSGRLSSIDDS